MFKNPRNLIGKFINIDVMGSKEVLIIANHKNSKFVLKDIQTNFEIHVDEERLLNVTIFETFSNANGGACA